MNRWYLKRIGWDIDLVAVLLNGPATFTESELKTAWKLTEPEKFRLNLDWKFTEFIIRSINKVDFTASKFEAALQLQIEVKWKRLVDQLLLGQNLLKNN